MNLVVDANVLIALVVEPARAEAVTHHLRAWHRAGARLHAPALMRYEVANALARVAATSKLSTTCVNDAWCKIAALPITEHGLDQGSRVIAVARQLGRTSAYDAAYVVLAERLRGQLWTLDGPLARNATSHGLPVRLIATPS